MVHTTRRVALLLTLALAATTWAQTPASPKWAGSWTAGSPTGFTLTRFDGAYYAATGLVYFLGGRMADGTTTDGSIWSYNPATNTYADSGVDMPVPISNYVVNPLQDATGIGFYTFCGRTAAGAQTFATQVFYPATGTTAQLTAADNYPGDGTHTCSAALNVVYNNKVYVAGGFNSTDNNVQTWVFDPMAAVGSKWTRLTGADLAQGRAYIMGAAVDGLIYAIGGAWWDGTALQNVSTVEVLDPAAATPSWNDAAVADLPEVCSSSRAWGFDASSQYEDPTDSTPLASKIIAGCGVWSTANNHVYAYSVATNSWAAFPSLVAARRDCAAEFLPLASAPALWMWGGYDSTGVVFNATEFYSLGLVPVELQSFSIE
jgi:hypothetical protein